MKTEDLFEAFGDIDESFIISARKPVQKKDRTLFFLIPSFAAAVAVCAGVNHFTNIQPETPEYQIDSNLQSTVSEITEPNTETTESENTRIPVLSVNPEKDTTVPQTETERNTSAGSEKEFAPQTEAGSEQVQIPETSVFTEAVKTETVITDTVPVVSEPVTEPEEDFDLYENVIGSFGANAILLDYTKDSRAAMIINEDGSRHYLEDGGTKSIVKMKDGEFPPEEEINEKLGCNSVKFSSNRDGSYTLYAGEYKEKVYELLKNSGNVLSIDEEQIVYECDYNIESMIIKSDDSVQDIINNYPDLNLTFSATQVDAPTAPDYNPQEIHKKYYCEIECTPETYEALKKLQDSGAEYHFKLCILDNDEPYITNSKNIFQR